MSDKQAPPDNTKRSGLSPLAQALPDVSKAMVFVVNEDGAAMCPAEGEGGMMDLDELRSRTREFFEREFLGDPDTHTDSTEPRLTIDGLKEAIRKIERGQWYYADRREVERGHFYIVRRDRYIVLHPDDLDHFFWLCNALWGYRPPHLREKPFEMPSRPPLPEREHDPWKFKVW